MSSSAFNSALSALVAHRTAVELRAGNVANAQTDAYKSFEARLSALMGAPGPNGRVAGGGVAATSAPSAGRSGAVFATASATSIAATGSGWLPVRTAPGASEQLYTRRGDFAPDENGYLRNGAGHVLFARRVGEGGAPVPVRIDRASLPARASSSAVYAANLPANAPPGTVVDGGTLSIVDAQGIVRAFAVTWSNRTTPGGVLPGVPAGPATGSVAIPASAPGTVPQWRAVLTAPAGSANGTESLALDFTFGTGAGVNAGLPIAIAVQSTDAATLAGAVAGGRVTLGYAAPGLASAPVQSVDVEFGAPSPTPGAASLLGVAGGTTAFAAAGVSVARAGADGDPAGDFVGAAIDDSGRIQALYSNGRRVAQYDVALAHFAAPGALIARDGAAFAASAAAGEARLSAAGGGALSANAREGANVDLGVEMVRTLTAQRAYQAGARLVATADEMLAELTRKR